MVEPLPAAERGVTPDSCPTCGHTLSPPALSAPDLVVCNNPGCAAVGVQRAPAPSGAIEMTAEPLPALVSRLEALAAAATPGPWRVQDCREMCDELWIEFDFACSIAAVRNGGSDDWHGRPYPGSEEANAALIVEAVNALPTLLAALRERDEAVRVSLINTPETVDFMAAVPMEAAHQRERWGVDHDAGKTPFDWFWLVGYLAQKAADAAVRGDDEKAKHHTISTAAALANWHAAIAGLDTRMRPGTHHDNVEALNQGTPNAE